jgi:Carboxypeptidase regulatory-like domain
MLKGGLLALFALALVAPAMAAAATISGTVTAEGGGPLQGVEVCPTPQPYTFETECVDTDASGRYQLTLFGADYKLNFSAFRNNLRYVSEWYDNATHYSEADLFHLGASENANLDAALTEGGSIGGTVTDESTGGPIDGVWVCAVDSEGNNRCDRSDPTGDYLINGLPSGTYSVEYEGGNTVNYLHEFYEDADSRAAATDVVVTAPATTAHIDAELTRGAEILGHVTDPRTGGPSQAVFVCANEQPPGGYQGCDTTDENGDYGIRSLPAGTYLVAFELEYFPWGLWAEQWWQGAATMAEADPVPLTPPETRTGIDGQATSPLGVRVAQDPHAGGGTANPPPPPPKKPAKKCRKGFHRKPVKGKRRCVRKHKKHRQRHK